MSARILDGKGIADALLDDLARRVQVRLAAGKPAPGLAVVLVGEDPASSVYVRNKRRAAKKVGIRAIDYDLPAHTTDDELAALIDRLNADPAIHGILVQLPLPGNRDATWLIHRIDPRKDVDGFHPRTSATWPCASSACAPARRAASPPCWPTPTGPCAGRAPPSSASATTSAGRWRWNC